MQKSDGYRQQLKQAKCPAQNNDRVLKALYRKVRPLRMKKKRFSHNPSSNCDFSSGSRSDSLSYQQTIRPQKLEYPSEQSEECKKHHSGFDSSKVVDSLMALRTKGTEKQQLKNKNKKHKEKGPCSLGKRRNTENSLEDSGEDQLRVLTELENMRHVRLPSIKEDLLQRKRCYISRVKDTVLEIQKGKSFQHSTDDRNYSFEYILNMLKHSKQRKASNKHDPLKGFENLSPNNLKSYIEYFHSQKQKLPVSQKSIYVSSKRIAPLRTDQELASSKGGVAGQEPTKKNSEEPFAHRKVTEEWGAKMRKQKTHKKIVEFQKEKLMSTVNRREI